MGKVGREYGRWGVEVGVEGEWGEAGGVWVV